MPAAGVQASTCSPGPLICTHEPIEEQSCLWQLDSRVLLTETKYWSPMSGDDDDHVSHTLRLVAVAAVFRDLGLIGI